MTSPVDTSSPLSTAPTIEVAGTRTARVASLLRLTRQLAITILYALVGLAVGLLVAVSAPALLGHKSFTVLTGSMRPTIDPGDVVVDERVSPLQVRPGDVVTFREPERKRLVTHRVEKITVGDGFARFVTRGDANDAPERWSVETGGKVGRVLYRVPKVGYAVNRVQTPQGRLALLVIPALLLAVYELIRIWRPREEEE